MRSFALQLPLVVFAIATLGCGGEKEGDPTGGGGGGGGGGSDTGGGNGGGGGGNGGGGNGGDTPCDATGFASSGAAWALPEGYGSLYGVAGSSSCSGGNNKPAFSTVDLTGDALPDLVVTDACDESQTGSSRWLVYANAGAGFATSPTSWSLPDGYDAFAALSGYGDCTTGNNQPEFSTFDLTGDGRPDLVVTDACDESQTGRSRWLVYRNTGSGFDTSPTSWSLPEGYDAFPGTASGSDCTTGNNLPEFSTFDLTGDAKPDLVVTDSCDDTQTGRSKWLVYRNTGSGFDTSATSWSLPDGYDAFQGTAGSGDCTTGKNMPEFSTLDLTGDGLPDIVVTDACDDTQTGRSQWLVYRNDGSGFAASGAAWSLPEGYDAFAGTASGGDCAGATNKPGFATFDLTGDALADIVVTAACDESQTGASRWLLYRNTGSGFAASGESWALPGGFDGFSTVAGTRDCSGARNVPEFTTFDLDGGASPDLVVTGACDDGATGSDRWLLYANVCG